MTRIKFFNFSLFTLSLSLLFLFILYHERIHQNCLDQPKNESLNLTFPMSNRKPRWYNIVSRKMDNKRIKIGLVHATSKSFGERTVYGDQEANLVNVHFKKISENVKWSDLFPQWIDESLPWDSLDCPKIPMPNFEEYKDLDLVVANVPCGGGKQSKTFEDVFRSQVNLVVANLLVRSVRKKNGKVFVVFIGSCGPLWELFRCDDLLWHEENYWIYKPDLRRLQQKVFMPVGSCQLASSYPEPGNVLLG